MVIVCSVATAGDMERHTSIRKTKRTCTKARRLWGPLSEAAEALCGRKAGRQFAAV